ncbi:hypothetical protein SAMN05216480_10342 [Pustulibacterium marinum]|uniref:Uncharacterized protein n=1 Tax=Pustulibacterium marinum TaxID=1224947 RepID=A0A1I7G0X7_9FLAO|nr:hypothetical protein [Pustulibacterium marinum]SFU42099.1 hypothetical protein SAMN05216480_10342 [Pustulibacterium marinum]
MKIKITILVLFQLSLGISLGIIAFHKWNDLSILDIVLIHLSAALGIALPGYIYLKSINNTYAFLPSLVSAIVCTFLGIFAYMLLAFFILSSIEILHNEVVAILVPVIIGTLGFNKFAFNINKRNNII